MRILILDDDFSRHETFIKFYKEDMVVCAQRYNDFLREVVLSDWDLIHLDHDLGNNGDTRLDGWGKEHSLNGADAVKAICELDIKDTQVIVHSMHFGVADRMVQDLQRAGIEALRKSFDHFLFR